MRYEWVKSDSFCRDCNNCYTWNGRLYCIKLKNKDGSDSDVTNKIVAPCKDKE